MVFRFVDLTGNRSSATGCDIQVFISSKKTNSDKAGTYSGVPNCLLQKNLRISVTMDETCFEETHLLPKILIELILIFEHYRERSA